MDMFEKYIFFSLDHHVLEDVHAVLELIMGLKLVRGTLCRGHIGLFVQLVDSRRFSPDCSI